MKSVYMRSRQRLALFSKVILWVVLTSIYLFVINKYLCLFFKLQTSDLVMSLDDNDKPLLEENQTLKAAGVGEHSVPSINFDPD